MGLSSDEVSESEDEDAAGEEDRTERDVGEIIFEGSSLGGFSVAATGRGEVWDRGGLRNEIVVFAEELRDIGGAVRPH